MSLLTVLIAKISYILAVNYFIFLTKRPRPNVKSFQSKFRPQGKDGESSYQVRQILQFFCKLVALILG